MTERLEKAGKSLCYCTNLRRSAGVLTEFYNEALSESGLTVTQYRLLRNLAVLGRANITRWAERTGLERSTMVRNVRSLVDHGLIMLTEGRGKTYTLSEKGRGMLDNALPLWENAQEKIRSFLGEEDARAILRIGEKLRQLDAE